MASRKRAGREEVALWMADSEDCLKVAVQNFELGNYHVSGFFIHSALERALKAAVIAYKQKAPPKTHNLKRLYSEVSDHLRLSQKQVDFLGEITPAVSTARDVDVAMALPREVYSKALVERYLSFARPILLTVKTGLGS